MFSQDFVELYGHSVERYGNLVELYEHSVEFYGISIELYGALVVFYGNIVEYYRSFVELYGNFIEYPQSGDCLENCLIRSVNYGWRLHSPLGWGIFGMGKNTFGVCGP
jgi:hypothetical protein